MRTKVILLSVILAISAVAAYADQAAYITKEQAEKAAVFLTGKMQIRHYCAPCDDKDDRVEDIKTVVAAPAGYQDYWEVKVNGEAIDLAYVYFQTEEGKWKNLAKELDIKVHDVPKYLE